MIHIVAVYASCAINLELLAVTSIRYLNLKIKMSVFQMVALQLKAHTIKTYSGFKKAASRVLLKVIHWLERYEFLRH